MVATTPHPDLDLHPDLHLPFWSPTHTHPPVPTITHPQVRAAMAYDGPPRGAKSPERLSWEQGVRMKEEFIDQRIKAKREQEAKERARSNARRAARAQTILRDVEMSNRASAVRRALRSAQIEEDMDSFERDKAMRAAELEKRRAKNTAASIERWHLLNSSGEWTLKTQFATNRTRRESYGMTPFMDSTI